MLAHSHGHVRPHLTAPCSPASTCPRFALPVPVSSPRLPAPDSDWPCLSPIGPRLPVSDSSAGPRLPVPDWLDSPACPRLSPIGLACPRLRPRLRLSSTRFLPDSYPIHLPVPDWPPRLARLPVPDWLSPIGLSPDSSPIGLSPIGLPRLACPDSGSPIRAPRLGLFSLVAPHFTTKH